MSSTDSYDFADGAFRAARIGETMKQQIVSAMSKPSAQRTYDDILLLKSYMLQTEFFEKSMLGSANPRQVNDLCRGLELEQHRHNDTVFNQGDIGDKVYIILSGRVEFIARFTIDLTQGETEIREKKLDTFFQGKIFGERALQFDEPRSATAVCVEDTLLVTVDKSVYLQVLEDVRLEQPSSLRPDVLAKKEGVMQVLSKVREKRTNQELEAAANYLFRKVEFFSKLSMSQVVEVCRVAETLTIWGRGIVCRQGDVGPVFYAVLTGSVEVWVNKDSASIPNRTGRNHDLTEGLGRMENQLVSGKTFGDRALNSTDSLRKASIVTCEDVTELLVIFRKDYENLIAATSQVETMTKIKLLRRTDLFHNLDMVHLRALANFMEPKTYAIDEVVVQAGRRATDLIVLEKGECNVMTEVLEGYAKDNYEEIMHQQNYHHYMEETATHHNAAAPVEEKPVEYNHHTLKKMKTTDKAKQVLDISKKESTRHQETKQQTSPAMLPAAAAAAAIAAAGGEASFESSVRGNTPGARQKVSREERKRNPRFASQQLVPLGRRKKISLGRIAPNSVLATYVFLSGTLHEEVYHPETIIATSLINAYTVSKHAFFNSLPKDSKHALVKLIKEYKPPMLTSLWENVPRVLDEKQWKMEKTWKQFKHSYMEHGHRSNILDSYKRMDNLHISVNSGNDPEVKLMPRHYLMLQQDQPVGSLPNTADRRKAEVTLDWGLAPGTPTSAAAAAAAAAVHELTVTLQTEAAHLLSAATAHTHHSAGSSVVSSTSGKKSHTSLETGVIYPPEHAHLTSAGFVVGAEVGGKNVPMVSFRIRQRLNLSRSMNALLDQQLSATNASNTASAAQKSQLANSQSLTALGADANSAGNSQTRGLSQHCMENPFTLVQIHREMTRGNAMNQLSTGRRPVRSYLRVCGSFMTCARAKEMADLQMEQMFLTLFHSEAVHEAELLMQWHTFNGFESMPLDSTDHFLIYCRSTPVEYACLQPSRNLFHAKFPAMCRPQQQRYAVMLINPLPLPALTQQKHQHPASAGADSHESDSDDNASYHSAGASGHAGEHRLGTAGKKLRNVLGIRRQSTAGAGALTSKAMSATFPAADAAADDADAQSVVKDGKPFHLSELAVVSETMAIADTRIEALRYAIENFGAVIPAKTHSGQQSDAHLDLHQKHLQDILLAAYKDTHPPGGAGPAASSPPQSKFTRTLQQKRKARGTLNQNAPPDTAEQQLARSLALGSITITLKPIAGPANGAAKGSAGTERVLRQLHSFHQQNHLQHPLYRMRICVLPLFRWILIDAQTLGILDFTKAFHEDAVKNIFLAEQDPSGAEAHSPARTHRGRATHSDEEDDDDDANASYAGEHAAHQTQTAQPQHGINQYRDYTRELLAKQELPRQLLTSVSEAGLLPKQASKALTVHFQQQQQLQLRQLDEQRAAVAEKLSPKHRRGSPGRPHSPLHSSTNSAFDEFMRQQANPTHPQPTASEAAMQSLHVLQQEMVAQEIGQQIQQLSKQRPANGAAAGSEELDPFMASLIDPSIDQSKLYANAGQTKSTADKEWEVTNARLQESMHNVQSTVAQTRDVLQSHDKLCDLEHATNQRYLGSRSQLAQQKALEMLQRRMEVIEDLQRHAVQPATAKRSAPIMTATGPVVTLASLVQTGAGSGQRSPESGTPVNNGRGRDKGAASTAEAQAQAAMIAAATAASAASSALSGTSNVAKRLHETLRALSDTLDAPYKQQAAQQQSALHSSHGHHGRGRDRDLSSGSGGVSGSGGGHHSAHHVTVKDAETPAPAAATSTSTAAAAAAQPHHMSKAAATVLAALSIAHTHNTSTAAPAAASNTATAASNGHSTTGSAGNSVASLSHQVSQSSLSAAAM